MEFPVKKHLRRFVLLTGIFSGFLLAVHPIGILADPEAKTIRELLERAKRSMEAGEFEKTIPAAEEAYRLSPQPETAALLGSAYEAQAARLVERGLTQEAFRLLEKASALSSQSSTAPTSVKAKEENPQIAQQIVHLKKYWVSDSVDQDVGRAVEEQNARVLFAQAMESYGKKQYDLARDLVRQGLRRNAKSAFGFELLGDVEFYSQHLQEAEESYTKAYQLEKEARLIEKLTKVREDMKGEEGAAEYLDQHFIIRYDRKENLEGSEIREYLREAYRTISQDFGYYLDYKTVVMLYEKQLYAEKSNTPAWSAGLYDGKIHIPAYGSGMDKSSLRKLIYHELTHIFVSDLSRDRAPIWLHEGLAQYEENKVVAVNPQMFQKAVRSKALLSWDQLKEGVSETNDTMKVMVFYGESFSLVAHMVEKFGFLKIKQLLQAISTDIPFEKAFQDICSVSFSSFFDRWQQEVAREFQTSST